MAFDILRATTPVRTDYKHTLITALEKQWQEDHSLASWTLALEHKFQANQGQHDYQKQNRCLISALCVYGGGG